LKLIFVLDQIKKIYADFFSFLRNPNQNKIDLPLKEKWRILFYIFLLDFLTVFLTMPILTILEDLDILKLDYDDTLFEYDFIFILLIAGVIIPIIEEFIFRFPLKYIWSKYFKFFFYSFAIVFALIHLANYNNNSVIFFILAPIIIFSQFVGGLTLGYIRLKLGFIWGVLQHSLFNCIIFVIGFLFFNPEILVDMQHEEFNIKIEQYLIKENIESMSKIYLNDNTEIDSVKIINLDIKSAIKLINQNNSIIFNKKGSISLYFKRKNDSVNSREIINKKLKKHFDFEIK